VCPGGVATNFALEEGRGRPHEALAGMMTSEDVAEVVVFVLERPRCFRLLELAFRPATEDSWG
jgi:NADP-dependent 3-hydroxy acid dehydrogenase YdfG